MNLHCKPLIFSIITEYNPLHLGHLIQLDTIKREHRDPYIISVMSGGFVQRGEAAVFDKYLRARAAVECGCDLVLELPFPWSCGSGEFFASGACALIDSLGVVDRLCFGSESGDASALMRMAERSADPSFDMLVAERAKKETSKSYIRLRAELYEEYYGERLCESPNDILGVEYLKALKKLTSKIEPYVIKRTSHHSATSSRAALRSGDKEAAEALMPKQLLTLVDGKEPSDLSYAFPAILYRLRNADASELEACADVPNGMGRRMINAANKAATLDEFYSLCADKRMTDARIRRMLIFVMTNVATDDLRRRPLHTNVLALNERGASILAEIRRLRKTNPDIPQLVTKPSDTHKLTPEALKQNETAYRAELLYTLCHKTPLDATEILRRTPYILNEGEKTDGRKKMD